MQRNGAFSKQGRKGVKETIVGFFFQKHYRDIFLNNRRRKIVELLGKENEDVQIYSQVLKVMGVPGMKSSRKRMLKFIPLKMWKHFSPYSILENYFKPL